MNVFDFIASGGGLASTVRTEQEAVAAGRSAPCTLICPDETHPACVRAAHPHDPDAPMGDDKPLGDVVPHVGFDADGQLVQWTCLPGDHAPDEAADPVADGRAEATRQLFASIDPALLVELLREGGHL